MNEFSIILPILHCPNCCQKLKIDENLLHCLNCQAEYNNNDGILDLLTKNESKFRKIEQNFWDYKYKNVTADFSDNRTFYFHDHFRRPLINLPNGSLILELGCGTRADSMEIAKSGKVSIATDISIQALRNARDLAGKYGVLNRMKFILAEAEKLPFADNSFDGAMMAASFHHLENPAIGLQEMKRVVKNNGYIILGVEPASWPYKTIFKFLKPLKKYIRNKRQRGVDSIADDQTPGFNKKSLRKLFSQQGLEILEIKPIKFTLEFYDSYLRLKHRLAGREPKPSKKLQRFYNGVDKLLLSTPGFKQFPWHWNLISRVKK
ncbi:MAG: class I SAM-dependent methyltransferase [Patescibacteria group bacterium]|jgi:ubiquinone/menaquinone biosynthesis C-methylase UbiE